jgi:hypothetical protein
VKKFTGVKVVRRMGRELSIKANTGYNGAEIAVKNHFENHGIKTTWRYSNQAHSNVRYYTQFSHFPTDWLRLAKRPHEDPPPRLVTLIPESASAGPTPKSK